MEYSLRHLSKTRTWFLQKLNRGEFGKMIIRFASAQVISNLFRMAAGLAVVKLMDPEEYGLFTGVGVFLGYILLGHGGILNGLSRELPYELGRGNDERARELASSAFSLSLLISAIAAFIFLAIGIIKFLSGEQIVGAIYTSYSVLGGMYLLNKQFLPTLYRTNSDFDSLSKQNIKTGLGSIATVSMVLLFGLYGLVLRAITLALYEGFLLFKNKPYNLDFQWKTLHFKKLFKTGWPIFIVGYVNPLWNTVVNSWIFSAGGALYFGFFSISNIILGAMGVIPSSFSQIVYPRMAIMLGQGKPVSEIIKSNTKPLFFQFIILLTLSFSGAYLLPLLIPILLPQYSEGITAAQWMLFVPVVQSFGVLNNIFNVVKEQKWYMFSLLTGALLGSAFIFFRLHKNGFQLEFFPQGLLLGKTIQQALALAFILRLKKNG